MMTSLKNSNKRKGFKERQAGRMPQKIVFEHGDSQGTTRLDVPVTPIRQPSTSQPQNLPRLVPPSERSDLPDNIVVTSVDVEADLWHAGSGRKVKSCKSLPAAGRQLPREIDTRHGYLDPKQYYGRTGYTEEEDVKLDYGDEQEGLGTISSDDLAQSSPLVDWHSVEAAWTTFPFVTDPGTLRLGMLVAWQVRYPLSVYSSRSCTDIKRNDEGSRYRPCHVDPPNGATYGPGRPNSNGAR